MAEGWSSSTAVARSPQDFYRLLCEQGVTVLNQTPSAFAQLSEEQALLGSVPWLRLVIFGGEALDLRMLRPWVERHGAETTVREHVRYYGDDRPCDLPAGEQRRSSRIGAA